MALNLMKDIPKTCYANMPACWDCGFSKVMLTLHHQNKKNNCKLL
jgi:hypothetical protein